MRILVKKTAVDVVIIEYYASTDNIKNVFFSLVEDVITVMIGFRIFKEKLFQYLERGFWWKAFLVALIGRDVNNLGLIAFCCICQAV